MKNYSPKSAGFTLVETLIAVAILMVAIAGPLTIASQALTSALGSRDAMIATYLAQDGMESIKNIKDNNVAAGASDWLDGINTSGDLYSVPHPFSYLSDPHTNVSCNPAAGISNCFLYTNDAGSDYFYGGTPPTDRPTPFTRFYSVVKTGNEAVVKVSVDWTENSISNEIKLQELMTNIKH